MAFVAVKVAEILGNIDGILDEGWGIIDSLGDDEYNDNTNDWCKMIRINEKLQFLKYRIRVFVEFHILIVDMENEKDRFMVQKDSQFYFIDFEASLDSMIKIGRTWKFVDYRCIDWIKRLTDEVVEMKKFFKENKVVTDKTSVIQVD